MKKRRNRKRKESSRHGRYIYSRNHNTVAPSSNVKCNLTSPANKSRRLNAQKKPTPTSPQRHH